MNTPAPEPTIYNIAPAFHGAGKEGPTLAELEGMGETFEGRAHA